MILIDGGVIRWVGRGQPPTSEPIERVEGNGLVAIPGLVNTHHHLYQVLTRVRAQEQGLFGWLHELYPVWAELDAATLRQKLHDLGNEDVRQRLGLLEGD